MSNTDPTSQEIDFLLRTELLNLTRLLDPRLNREFRLNMARNLRTPGRFRLGDTTAAPPVPKPAGGLQPVTTLVSMLPMTTYKETDEAEGTVNTSEYIKVQLDILKYLGKHPSDKLTARQACHWTECIADNKQPTAKDALRLCYYMRSQGFDTYAFIKDGSISLYLSNQLPEARPPRKDLLYWKQNYSTNDIEHAPSSAAHNPAHGARMHDPVPSIATMEGLLTRLHQAELAVAAQHGQGAGDAVPQAPNQEQGDVQPPQNNLATLMAGASEDLEALLLSDMPDTDAIEAAIARMEQYQSQVAGD